MILVAIISTIMKWNISRFSQSNHLYLCRMVLKSETAFNVGTEKLRNAEKTFISFATFKPSQNAFFETFGNNLLFFLNGVKEVFKVNFSKTSARILLVLHG